LAWITGNIYGAVSEVFFNDELKYTAKRLPQLKDKTVIAGSLMADSLLEHSKDKASIKRHYRIPDEKPVVHVVSTWGKDSLYNTFGDYLFENLPKLKEKYTFLFSIHPRYDELNDGDGESREEIISRAQKHGLIVDTNDNWKDFVCISDYAISDHTSITLFHFLLNHKLLLSNISREFVVEDSPLMQLSLSTPKLCKTSHLLEQLKTAPYPLETQSAQPILESLNSHLFSARNLHKKYLEELITNGRIDVD
jgi:hypothetical protein